MSLYRMISRITGFDGGILFYSEEEVRDYFTPENMVEVFETTTIDDWDRVQLREWAENVIDNRWHMGAECEECMFADIKAMEDDRPWCTHPRGVGNPHNDEDGRFIGCTRGRAR